MTGTASVFPARAEMAGHEPGDLYVVIKLTNIRGLSGRRRSAGNAGYRHDSGHLAPLSPLKASMGHWGSTCRQALSPTDYSGYPAGCHRCSNRDARSSQLAGACKSSRASQPNTTGLTRTIPRGSLAFYVHGSIRRWIRSTSNSTMASTVCVSELITMSGVSGTS